MPPAASALLLHQAVRLSLQSSHVSLPSTLHTLKIQLRRVSLTLTAPMHILFWYLSCTSSHLPRCNLYSCSLPYGCLSFSISLTWLNCKDKQKTAGWLFSPLPLANPGSALLIPAKVTSFTLFPQSTAPFWPLTFYIPLCDKHLFLLTALGKK